MQMKVKVSGFFLMSHEAPRDFSQFDWSRLRGLQSHWE